MLQALVPRREKVAVGRGRVIALLDKFDLERAGVGERDADCEGRGRAVVAEVLDRQPFEVEERPDTENLRPVAHRSFDVAHHVAILADGSKNPAHGPPDAFTLTFWM